MACEVCMYDLGIGFVCRRGAGALYVASNFELVCMGLL